MEKSSPTSVAPRGDSGKINKLGGAGMRVRRKLTRHHCRYARGKSTHGCLGFRRPRHRRRPAKHDLVLVLAARCRCHLACFHVHLLRSLLPPLLVFLQVPPLLRVFLQGFNVLFQGFPCGLLLHNYLVVFAILPHSVFQLRLHGVPVAEGYAIGYPESTKGNAFNLRTHTVES